MHYDSNGAAGRDRTCDLLVTNELLYQLSYSGTGFIITYWAWLKIEYGNNREGASYANVKLGALNEL